MSRRIHVIGDGIAGLTTARALHDAGHRVTVHGDRRSHEGRMTALVHLHAGRSFRTTPAEDSAFTRLVEWVEPHLGKTVASTTMLRPITGETGERLTKSLDRAKDDVRRVEHPTLGEAFEYGPAFGIDAPGTLRSLAAALEARGVEFRRGRVHPGDVELPAVLAVGAALPDWLEGVDLRRFGGDVVSFDWDIEHAFSAGGVHAVPAPGGGTCVGSTWWSPPEPPAERESVRELRGRLDRLGVRPGRAVATWRSIRCVHHTDRRPLVGRVAEDLWVVGALGTRGWLWGPHLSELLAGAVDGTTPPAAFDVGRTEARSRWG